MAKQPEFKLYRICNKENGKAFSGYLTAHQPSWSSQGTFYRKPETICRHIQDIIHKWEWKPNPKSYYGGRFHRTDLIPSALENLYVEVYSVLQLSVQTASATNFLIK